MKTLVTGGIRSGKSAVAEGLLVTTDPAGGVTYVATARTHPGDADWTARILEHQMRRPSSWRTHETTDLADALAALSGPALVDSLGGWLVAALDRLDAWDRSVNAWRQNLESDVEVLVAAWAGCPHDLVAVTDEVGFGGVAEHRSARVFADELGRLNQRIAAASDRVLLVVAGQVLPVKDET